jgi:hypothetical protein
MVVSVWTVSNACVMDWLVLLYRQSRLRCHFVLSVQLTKCGVLNSFLRRCGPGDSHQAARKNETRLPSHANRLNCQVAIAIPFKRLKHAADRIAPAPSVLGFRSSLRKFSHIAAVSGVTRALCPANMTLAARTSRRLSLLRDRGGVRITNSPRRYRMKGSSGDSDAVYSYSSERRLPPEQVISMQSTSMWQSRRRQH